MDVIDDEGRLFGWVNVIDALVVLLVLAVVTAGAALVFQDEVSPQPEAATTHVTLDLGSQPDYIVAAINEGDTFDASKQSRLTITDVHLTPQDNQTRVFVRAELRGPINNDGNLEYADAPPRLGRTLDVNTQLYTVSGQIRDVGESSSLSVDETTVVVRAGMDPSDARDVTPGDEIRLAGRSVATIEDVAVYTTGNPMQRAVFVEATLNTHREQDERRFGGRPVRRGQDVFLSTDSYTINGRIERVDTELERGTKNVLLEDVLDVETAASLTEGDVVRVAGTETARIESVTTYATQNPDRKQVVVGVTLQTLTYAERPRFGTVPVQRGATIVIETDDYTLSGPIERVDTLEPAGAVSTRTVVLRMEDKRDQMVAAIEPGMTEQSAGETIARVTGVSAKPSLIIATGDNGTVNVVDHPFLRDVTITTELRVRETTNGVRFKGQSLRQGADVVIDLGTIIIRATVVSVGP